MSTLQERLQSAFDPERHSYADLARAAGVKQPSVSDWFSGHTKTLKAAAALGAADYLGVSSVWLATGRGMRTTQSQSQSSGDLAEPPLMLGNGAQVGSSASFASNDASDTRGNPASNVRLIHPIRYVPLISAVCAGTFADSPLECAGDDPPMVPAYHCTPGARSFALEVHGDSMTAPAGVSPSFPHGSRVIVDPDVGWESGDYVIARDGDSSTFKRIVRDGSRWFLKPLNPAYPVLEITNPAVAIVGRAVEWSGPSGRL